MTSIVPFGNFQEGKPIERVSGASGSTTVGGRSPPFFIIGTDYFRTLGLAQSGAAAERAAPATVRRELRAVDDRLPVLALTTMQGFHDRSLELWGVRLGGRLFAAFGLLALALAVVKASGIAIGLPLATLIGTALAQLLYGVSPFDAMVFTSAPAILAAAALIACYLPARRATRIMPLTALRSE